MLKFPDISRRLVASAPSSNAQVILPSTIATQQRRTAFWFGSSKKDNFAAPKNPVTEEYLKRKPSAGQGLVRGGLASSSIFEDEEVAGAKSAKDGQTNATEPVVRDPEIMAAALDPDPASRRRWERKMVIRGIQKRERLTRSQELKRQEREIMSKSHNIRTSVKKLGPLARQIAGKTVEEAIVQMRFSKKKAAIDVREHLEHARNEAIVKRGMGLGAGTGQKSEMVSIRTKEGKLTRVTDPTELYVDQAWVGKGDYGRTPDHRARGAIYMMKNPTTHIALVLKEQATRLRQHEEAQEKLSSRKLWTQLPNRPVNGQRQYYSW